MIHPPGRSLLLALFLSLLVLLPASSLLQAGGFSVDLEDSGDVAIRIDGELFTRFVSSDQDTNKCYLWPVIGPGGTALTRAFPMEDVEGEKQDHPHHRSIFFGLEHAGGHNTWHEKRTFTRNGKVDERRTSHLGRQVCRKILQAEAAPDGSTATLVVKIDNLAPDGTPYLMETRSHLFHLDEESGSRIIDIEIVLSGTSDDAPTTIVGKKDSGLSIRVAHSMCVDAGQGGRIINSAGDTDKDAWGKRTPWVDFNGPVDGRTMGIAILNHPDSFRHPTPWHARTYGLFTANPFALKEVAGEQESGDVLLRAGSTITLKHRIILHEGDEVTAKIAEAWDHYAEEK